MDPSQESSLLEIRTGRASSTRSNDRTPLLADAQKLIPSTSSSSVPVQNKSSNNNNNSNNNSNANDDFNPDDVVNITDEQVNELDSASSSSSLRGRTNSVSGRMQRIRDHFYIDTNVQIGLEMLPPLGGKIMFYSWYVVLIVAMILSTNLNWQYTCNDVCGIRECHLGKVNSVPEVTSQSCASIQTVSVDSSSSEASSSSSSLFSSSIFYSVKNTVADSEQQQEQQQQVFHESSHSFSSSTSKLLPPRVEVYTVDENKDGFFDSTMLDSFTNNNHNNNNVITKKYCESNNNTDLPAGTNETVCAVSWFGGFGNILDSRLNRFVHLRFSMPRPQWTNETPSEASRTLSFYVTFVLALKNATAISDQGVSGNRVRASAPVTCRSGEVQCDGVTIPVVFGSVTNQSTFTLVAYDVPSLAFISAIERSAVQAIFQKAGYTIATMVCRYVFFVATFIQLAQLMYSRYTVWNHLKSVKEKKRRRKQKQLKMKQLQQQQRQQEQEQIQDEGSNNKNIFVSANNVNASSASADAVTTTIASKSNNDNNKKVNVNAAAGPVASDDEQEDKREHLGEFEQNWALLLNVMLLLYMNPFFAVSIYVDPTPRVFMFLEYKIPLYFIFTVVLCVLALCLATLETKPSFTMRIFLVLLFLLIFVLDLVDSGNKGWHFNTVECPNFQCSSIRWAILTILITVIFVIAFLLFYLHRNLAQLPYLATRPRQLSMRLMIFIFTAYVAYYVFSTVFNLAVFAHNDMLDQSHAELRLGTIISAFTFVTIITTAFKFVLRTDRIPPHPSDLRWKKVVWSPKWYTWLNLHGGGAYIFFNEDEEEEFDIVQETKQDNVSSASDDSDWDRKSENPEMTTTTTNAYRLAIDGGKKYEVGGGRVAATTLNGSTISADSRGYSSYSQQQQQQQQKMVPAPSAASGLQHQQRTSTPDDSDISYQPYSDPSDFDDDAYGKMALGRSGGDVKKGHGRTESAGSLSSRVFRRIESFASLDDQNMSKFWKKPQQFIDKVEDFTIATAKIFHLVSAARQPFMNLESAIDCFNLAYEAYGVPVSKGDERIHTGITFVEALHQTRKVTKKFVCCCLHSEAQGDGGDDGDSSTSSASESGDSAPNSARGKNNINNKNSNNSKYDNHSDALVPEFSGTFGHSYNASKNKYTKAKNGKDLLLPTETADYAAYQQEKHRDQNISFATQDSIDVDPYGAAKLWSQKQKQQQQQLEKPRSSSLPPLTSPRTSTATATDGKVPINTEQYGYKQLFVYENFDMQVVISEMDTTTCERHRDKHPRYVIAFRGTDNQTNLRQDFRFTREVWREMQKELSFVNSLLEAKVHKGFLEHWNAMQHAVLDKMAQLVLAKPESRIYVTGHSLGGAVACLCGYTMVVRFRGMMIPHHRASSPSASGAASVIADELDTDRMVQVYTFGMPKLGDSIFREEYNKKVPYTFRIVNESDTVSGIGVFMGHHVGEEICIDRFGNFICNPMPVEKLFRPTQGKGVGLRHHSMYGYSASLNKIAAHTSLGSCPARCLEPYVPELATMNTTMNNNNNNNNNNTNSNTNALLFLSSPTSSSPSSSGAKQNLSGNNLLLDSQQQKQTSSSPRGRSASQSERPSAENSNTQSRDGDDDGEKNDETGSNDSDRSVREIGEG